MSPMSSALSPHDRVSKIMNAMETPHVCDQCGSTHFFQADFRQYAVGHYASSPGGDLHPLGGMPQSILICICGWPKSPNIGGIRGGRTATGEIAEFIASLKKAQAFLSVNPADGLRAELVATLDQKLGQATADLAMRTDVDALGAQVRTVTDGLLGDLAGLAEKVDQVTQAVTAPDPVKAPPARPGGKKE